MKANLPEGGRPNPTHIEGIMFGVEGISQLLQRAGVFTGPHLPRSTKLTLQAPVVSAEVVTPYETVRIPTSAATRVAVSQVIEVKLDRKKGNGSVCVPRKDNEVTVPVKITEKGILADPDSLSNDSATGVQKGMSPDDVAAAYEAIVPYAAFIAPLEQSSATPINRWRD